MNFITKLDNTADNFFEKIRGNKFIDKVFYLASEVADFSIGWHLIAFSLVLFDSGLLDHWIRLAIALLIESVLVNQFIKKLFNRERPPISEKLSIHGRRPKTTSFPSGHSSSATVAVILLSLASPKYIYLWIFLGLLVATSRIHNRMHHLSDVLAGVILGSAFALSASYIWPI